MESSVTFSALLLAGGQSRRMGRDKALLPMPDSNRLLWQRQLAVLEDLRPREVLWSGPARPGLPDDVRVVPDHFSEVGPLAGLHAGLEKATSDLLVVLAVDLPRMTADFLGLLLKASSRTCGAVAEQDGFFEPLGAVYPKTLLPLIARQIERKCYAFQEMISLAIGEGMLEPVTLFPSQTELFTNWNFIEDLSPPSS